MHNFRNLKIWQKAMDLTDIALYYADRLPAKERYNLTDQIIDLLAQFLQILHKARESLLLSTLLGF
jgi:hypothetical protein